MSCYLASGLKEGSGPLDSKQVTARGFENVLETTHLPTAFRFETGYNLEVKIENVWLYMIRSSL